MSIVLVNEKEEIQCNNIIKWYKNNYLWWCYKRKHKRTNWLEIAHPPYRISIIGGFGKIISLFNLISYQPYIDKIHLYAKNPSQAKFQLTVCSCHVTYAFQSESTLYSFLNVK